MTLNREIPYYNDYVSENLQDFLKEEMKEVKGIDGLTHIGEMAGIENLDSLKFLCDLYLNTKDLLSSVLNQREKDRSFIDQRTKAYYEFNKEYKIDLHDKNYKTVLGDTDENDRIVIGPIKKSYCSASNEKQIAPIPDHLKGFHVTLFGPPENAKLSINAMNSYHRKLKDEPRIIEEILKTNTEIPKWGADDEDSKTPLRKDLNQAAENLKGCFNRDISFYDKKRDKSYKLAGENLAIPIKRFPGLALPCTFLYYNGNPIPLHLYDFALHLFEHWHNEKALTFYVPKLENEEEARYITSMIECAERMVQEKNPSYKVGTVRVIIVLENPRAVFRVNEMIDALYPYFVGASLGWHDYLGSAARLFKDDGNYRIPVKADPDIVIKYIKASHDLLANVVGERGGIKIGGMYGILPIDNDLKSDSFQITIRGYFRDVITQLKRNLSGFWVAHPDFIRIGIAIKEAWRIHKSGDCSKLKTLIDELLNEQYAKEIWSFVEAKDSQGLDPNDPLYARSLIVADIKESTFIANNHPDEIRYNVFQMLQYLTDWLTGNGCVALPTHINGTPARVMDDLATAERSRWEVWHEITHNRFDKLEFIKIVHEEMNFIRRDFSNEIKIVQVKYTQENSHWYDVALKLLLKLMTDEKPVEFATELLMPFTLEKIRKSDDPWALLNRIDSKKYSINNEINILNHYFEACGAKSFALENRDNFLGDESLIINSVNSFSVVEIIEAASFHGDIGQTSKTLDATAKKEQELVSKDGSEIKGNLIKLGAEYLKKFGFKYLISAQGKNSNEILKDLEKRLENSKSQEIKNAKAALLEITLKRLSKHPINGLKKKLTDKFGNSGVTGAQIALSFGENQVQTLSLGDLNTKQEKVGPDSHFQIASLSKTFASAFSIEFFFNKKIGLDTKVNELLESYKSDFRLISKKNNTWGDRVSIKDLMSHHALNMHYVFGVPATDKMPAINQFLDGNKIYGYETIEVINEPGKKFNYSGAGFIVLEYLIELISNDSIESLSRDFFKDLGIERNLFKPSQVKLNVQGFTDEQKVIESGYKNFPLFAAGMFATTNDVLKLLQHLSNAYDNLDGSGGISHDTAIEMSYGVDNGSIDFMSSKIGLGVFILESLENRFYLHQGANDGFRAIYLYCFDGPDKHKGASIVCNSEFNGVLFVSQVMQEILKDFEFLDIDTTMFKTDVDFKNISTEQVVNIGYKEFFLKGIKPRLPEKIKSSQKKHFLSEYNLVVGASIKNISNQQFALAENLISPYEAEFDPALFGREGKVMDSWETVRHNSKEFDSLDLVLQDEADINYIWLSTKYHDGNQVESVSLISDKVEIIEEFPLLGHSEVYIKLKNTIRAVKKINVKIFPDGGLTRIGAFTEIPEKYQSLFIEDNSAYCKRFEEQIPAPIKPPVINFEEVQSMYGDRANRKNLASSINGAKILRVSDEHYSSGENVISPLTPLNMFDGLESKRSRTFGHFDFFELKLAKPYAIEEIVLDFSFFKNNNPLFIEVEALIQKKWVRIIDKKSVKAYQGNKLSLKNFSDEKIQILKFKLIPDGGLNRVYVYEKDN